MTEEIIKKTLSPLKRIAPSSDFMARSKAVIFMTAQAPARSEFKFRVRLFESLTFTGAIGLASILVLAGLGSLSYMASDRSGQVASSFNNESLITEAESANFQLQIKEITYFDESAKQVAIVLDQITESNEN